MGLKENIEAATRTVLDVQYRVRHGAANKFGDVLQTGGYSLYCVYRIRQYSQVTPASPLPPWLRSDAAKADQKGCGNCGEQAALAFKILFDAGVRPIDYFKRTNADHAFVVIGRKKETDPSDFTKWGDVAAICDPWAAASFAATEIPDKAYGAKPFQAKEVFRVE